MVTARILRVYAGGPREVALPGGGTIFTGLHKTERTGLVEVGEAGLEGDGWGSPEVHGLPDQALCIYPVAHWRPLREALKGARGVGSVQSLVEGSFGENLAVDGIDEERVRIGSRWRWGTVRMEVTMARSPCATLTQVHGLPTLAKEIARSGRTGWYCRVLEGGAARAADPLVLLEQDPAEPTVAEAWRSRTSA
jgi:MOSC domain-containing protein YiiM